MKSIVGSSISILFILLMLTVAVGCSSDSSDNSSSIDTETPASDTIDDGDTAGYAIVDTGQVACYDDSGELVTCPAEGEPFYGQDSQHDGHQPSYTDNGDGNRQRHRADVAAGSGR